MSNYDDTLNESNEIRSSTVAASWSSPLGPMTLFFQLINES